MKIPVTRKEALLAIGYMVQRTEIANCCICGEAVVFGDIGKSSEKFGPRARANLRPVSVSLSSLSQIDRLSSRPNHSISLLNPAQSSHHTHP